MPSPSNIADVVFDLGLLGRGLPTQAPWTVAFDGLYCSIEERRPTVTKERGDLLWYRPHPP
jgi:hypothetical protein